MSNHLTAAGRNPLYEGLFEGETQGQREARLAAARDGGRPAFEREERYVVAKISKMHPHPTFRRRHLESLKRELSGVLVDCVVVERDWPEYETVWRMIEARVTGQAGSMVECPHRCGSVFAKESYGAGFIEGSGMCPACDAATPAKDIVNPGDEPTPPELLAAKLIDTWRAVHGRPVPWEKAVEITAITTSMSSEERERLLAMADAPASNAAPSLGEFWFEYLHPNGERHTVTVSREQVLEEMPDFIFEALCGKFCNCEPVGETNVIECRCDEYAEEFQLVTAAPGGVA